MIGKATIGILAFALGLSAASTAQAEEFSWIMQSVAAAGSLSNGDGHYWEFRKADGDAWEVEGARGEIASVTAAGENKIKVNGFPASWGANGGFDFSREAGTCTLKSDHGPHELEWTC